MKLSDVVAGAGLSGYAEIALLIFFAVFVVVCLRVLLATPASLERAARLPFDDEPTSPPSPRSRAE